jgi:hypothetical protein
MLKASAALPTGNYTIRKYSYFIADGIQYNFNKDISFNKVNDGAETLQTINDEVILYQGTIKEYPDYTAQGEEFEFYLLLLIILSIIMMINLLLIIR